MVQYSVPPTPGWVKQRMDFFRQNRLVAHACVVYIAVFLLSIPVWYFAREYKNVVVGNSLMAGTNVVFVQSYGYVWFTAAYVSHVFLYINEQNRIPSPVMKQHGFKYLLVTLCYILVQRWCFGASIVERINVASGGHCDNPLWSMDQCKADPNAVWIDGFDLLSHYYILLSLSLMLWHNRESVRTMVPSTTVWAKTAYLMLVPFCQFLLSVWFLEFCITSIFFHTVGERFAGLIAIPLVWTVIGAHYYLFSSSPLSLAQYDTV